MRRHRPLRSTGWAVLLVATIVTGCGLVPGGGGVVREGNCTLELTDDSTGQRLEGPPFVLLWQPRSERGAQLSWRRTSGWRGTVRVHITPPDGQVVDEGSWGVGYGQEGTGTGQLNLREFGVWRVRMEDWQCAMEFPVEVRAPGG